MKIWMILLVSGQIAGTIGPTPDNNLERCLELSDAQNEDWRKVRESGFGVDGITPLTPEAYRTRTACIASETRPLHTYKPEPDQ